MFRNFGCLAYVTSVKNNDKFSPRAIEYVFVSYTENKKTYKFFI